MDSRVKDNNRVWDSRVRDNRVRDSRVRVFSVSRVLIRIEEAVRQESNPRSDFTTPLLYEAILFDKYACVCPPPLVFCGVGGGGGGVPRKEPVP